MPNVSRRFVRTLHAFEREIEERAPGYFDYYALRVDAGPSLDPRFAAFCERVRNTTGSSLLPVCGRDALNAVDLAFDARLAGWRDDLVRNCSEFDIEPLYASLLAEDDARRRRIAAMPRTLEHNTDYAAGEGTIPIVLLNAIGQELDYWFPLIDALTPRHRVIAFEPRGMIADQLRDIEAILEREGAVQCTLLGWCTGPKVAVEFASRKPDAVASMIFLNPTFRCAGTPRELETAYERNSDPLFRAVAARPSMAASVMKSLQASAAGPPIDLEDEGGPDDVVAAMSATLRPHVAHPFRSEEVLVEYTRQILDFWSYDSLARAGGIDVPVLILTAELDRVAAPEMAQEAARRLRNARLESVPYATHYCLYDRPDFVAERIDEFLRERNASSIEPAMQESGA